MLSSACRFGVVHTAAKAKVASAPSDAPVNTLLPQLNRTDWEYTGGGSLFGNSGTWTGAEPITYTYQWYLDAGDVPIDGKTSANFGAGGEYGYVYLVVTATNSFGSASAISSEMCFIYGPQ